MFEASFGADTVTDFQDGADKIIFSGVAGVTSFADLSINQVGADVLITYGDGANSITLQNTLTSAIDASDFGFV